MRPHSSVLASLASVFRIPMTRPTITSTTSALAEASQQHSSFSTTPSLAKRKSAYRPDKRVTLIRYFLNHPLTPRPLRFSRNRYLRHWTIHRAWNLFQSQTRTAHEHELQRQQQAMSAACEELRTGCGEQGSKLFRVSMNKRGVFTDLFPLEYSRLQTESPPRDGWNHDWKKF
ncbi:hypothetical protein BGW36DRAFT_382516 [Talaromyces proteolyticus]|uniref:Large ribosomal subunit protein mL40 n=1 Tax=Talaromyces proteolyticus TaxID=1131652 RepID=A0AAD4KRE3_9EURO|nr:uncharacterized protein BGW36DRAFT_382516 [Talaromyces proteolyticus]KAH8695346.1 hypothetical protein BGW36DRAFT_382516 [Talaromyces proteolyticus]